MLATVVVLPLVGLFFFRLYDNQLIRQTQAELIAQSRVLATIYAQEVKARLDSGLTLGAEMPPNVLPDPGDQFTPIRPALDLTANDLFGGGPMRQPRKRRPQPAYVEIGARLMPIIRETQKVTLAGFRILDPQGVVIAGRQEVGQSLAHIEEVADALHGQYRATLRNRVPGQAAAADLFLQPRPRRARVLGDARHRRQPRRRRDLHLADAEQHLRPSLPGARASSCWRGSP